MNKERFVRCIGRTFANKFKRERWAVYCAIGIIVVLLIIFGIAFGVSYKKEKNKTKLEHEFFIIDKINIAGTFVILLCALIYWSIFYHGKLAWWDFRKYNIKNHATEAFLMYTMIYTFGIGILMPFIKWAVSQENYASGMYAFYPIVFLSMILGYYLYELIKIWFHHIDHAS